jgi:hypothetical protein
LEALAVEMYARGLSTRDIEALFADEDGRSLLSRTAVSEVTERLWAQCVPPPRSVRGGTLEKSLSPWGRSERRVLDVAFLTKF